MYNHTNVFPSGDDYEHRELREDEKNNNNNAFNYYYYYYYLHLRDKNMEE